jgi:hypothetical protein
MATQSDPPQVEKLAQRLQDGGNSSLPLYDNMKLQWNHRHMSMTIMCEAWRRAGRDPDDPGNALQLYFPEREVLLVDLS